MSQSVSSAEIKFGLVVPRPIMELFRIAGSLTLPTSRPSSPNPVAFSRYRPPSSAQSPPFLSRPFLSLQLALQSEPRVAAPPLPLRAASILTNQRIPVSYLL